MTMKLNIVHSGRCPLHYVRMSGKLRHKLSLDIGDWLLFDTKEGLVSLMVSSNTTEDATEFGDFKAVVSDECALMGVPGGDVSVKQHDLTIGADLEFFIVDKKTNKIVEAFTLFDHDAEMGSDGELAEMRPDYAISPDQVTENIFNIVKTLQWRLPKSVKTVASSWYNGLSCGFHMHFGLPPALMTFAAEHTDDLLKNIIHTMDYFIGVTAHSIDEDNKRRLSNNYGKPGDYRISMRTLEYRTPGGYHLRTRKHTNSLLCLGFSVMDAIINECYHATDGWLNMDPVTDFTFFMNRFNIPDYTYICNVMNSKDKDVLLAEQEKVAQALLGLGSDYIDEVVLSPATNTDLIEGWI